MARTHQAFQTGTGHIATLRTQGSRTEEELEKPDRMGVDPLWWPLVFLASYEREREQAGQAGQAFPALALSAKPMGGLLSPRIPLLCRF